MILAGFAMLGLLAGQATGPLTDAEFRFGVETIRQTLRDDLLDYDGARIQRMKIVRRVSPTGERGVYFCGEINAPNSEGGYTGWRQVAGGVLWRGGDNLPLRALWRIEDPSALSMVARGAQGGEETQVIASTACTLGLIATLEGDSQYGDELLAP